MQIEVGLKYFGMIADFENKDIDSLVLDEECSLSEFKELLEKKIPELDNISYQLAVNKKLATEGSFVLSESDEVAILPPFAGG